MASKAIPGRLNAVLGSAIVAANLAVFFLLPFAPWPAVLKLIAIFLLVLSTPAHWALVHEAIHSHLLADRRVGEWFGRVLCGVFGLPFRAARFAHLRHHRYNRLPSAREEVFDPARQSRIGAYAFHYFRIAIGLYVGELAVNLLCFLPRGVLERHLRSLCPATEGGSYDRVIRDTLDSLPQIRFDAVCVIALFAAAFFAYGAQWPLLLALLIGRGFIISQLDHAPHHATPIDEREYALNMTAPRWLQAALLNFNFHRNHHHQPQVTWNSLPQPASHQPGDVSFVRAVLRQWRGPIAVSDARVQARAPLSTRA